MFARWEYLKIMVAPNMGEDKTCDRMAYLLLPLGDIPLTDRAKILRNTGSAGAPCGPQVKHRPLSWQYV